VAVSSPSLARETMRRLRSEASARSRADLMKWPRPVMTRAPATKSDQRSAADRSAIESLPTGSRRTTAIPSAVTAVEIRAGPRPPNQTVAATAIRARPKKVGPLVRSRAAVATTASTARTAAPP
jgi:hypothetical protein